MSFIHWPSRSSARIPQIGKKGQTVFHQLLPRLQILLKAAENNIAEMLALRVRDMKVDTAAEKRIWKLLLGI